MDQAPVIAIRLIAGLAFSAAIGWLAYRRRSLSRSGVMGAILIGTLTFGFGGLMPGLLLIAFFISSSVLSHYKQSRKTAVADKFDKTGRRDFGQALANGGATALFGLASGLALLGGNATASLVCFGALVGALASANADTWATELGVISRAPPRLITRLGKVVEPGTSGGVTLLGTAAALAGAGFIGLVHWFLLLLFQPGAAQPGAAPALLGTAVLWYNLPVTPANLGTVVLAGAALAGFAGSLCDSLIGATVQGIYFSQSRSRETERRVERDGQPNRLVRGWRWMTNDWVNFISSLAGAALGALIVGVSL